MMETMEMYFYWGADVVFLFESWTITDNTGLYLLALAASFLVAILVEFITTRRIESNAIYGVAHGLQLLLSYALMLVLMTFNAGLFIAIMLGYTLGYSLFGFTPITFKQKGDIEINLSQKNMS
jgi:solute carrier family 31 (copper transporter), member 1